MYKCYSCDGEDIKVGPINVKGKQLIRMRQLTCSTCDAKWEVVETSNNKKKSRQTDNRKFVVTSALNNKSIDTHFLGVLRKYCKLNKAELLIIPVRYIQDMSGEQIWFPQEIKENLLHDNLEIKGANCKILGGLRISATAENPLSGIDPMSKGNTLIIGHPQTQMRTLPVLGGDSPILWSTGTITENTYSDTKLGYKAAFNHSFSALLVDYKSNTLHVRNLNWDGSGFNDLNWRYDISGKHHQTVEALVTGDEHALFADQKVKEATYTNRRSMAKVLKPNFIVRHDVLDSHSISHHDRQDFIKTYAKHHKQTNSLRDELDLTLEYIKSTTPKGSKNILVSSNHNDHLHRWLNEADPKKDPKNALLYHELMFMTLTAVEHGRTCKDAFELYCLRHLKGVEYEFTSRKSYKFFDIEVGLHGDKGVNGAKGTRSSLAKLPEKCIIGHSHSPGWEKGCIQVGTSSILNMDYTSGSPSSWRHCHCIIHKNGKRQLVFITNGRWR